MSGILLPGFYENSPSGGTVVGVPPVHDAVGDLAITLHCLVPERVRHQFAEIVPIVPLTRGHGRRARA